MWQHKWRVNRYCHQICQQIYWLSVNMLADLLELPNLLTANLPVSISGGRLTDFHKIYWPDLLTFTQILLGRFPYFNTKSASSNEGRDMIVTKSASRFTDCHQIWWQICWHSQQNFWEKWGDVSAGKYTDCHHICQQICWILPNLLTEMWGASISAGRFMDSHKLYWPIYWLSPNLPADLLTLMKSANRNVRGVSAIRFTDCHQTCWQICWLSPNLLVEMGGYFLPAEYTDCHQICRQIYWLSHQMCWQK